MQIKRHLLSVDYTESVASAGEREKVIPYIPDEDEEGNVPMNSRVELVLHFYVQLKGN